MTTRSKQWYTNNSRPSKKACEQYAWRPLRGSPLYTLWGARQDMGQRTIKRGPGQQRVEGKSFRLADEVCYMQRRAAQRQSRIVTVGPLVLFSPETGEACFRDTSDQLPALL